MPSATSRAHATFNRVGCRLLARPMPSVETALEVGFEVGLTPTGTLLSMRASSGHRQQWMGDDALGRSALFVGRSRARRLSSSSARYSGGAIRCERADRRSGTRRARR
jgi:hypothetical protein